MANERRLIDADTLIDTIENKDWYHVGSQGNLIRGARSDSEALYKADDVYGAIENAPTVDAVEVVRCAQCCWNDRDGRCMNPKCGKSWYGCPVPDEHFCSYGEKREVE